MSSTPPTPSAETAIIFTLTWRYLSHAAVPAMLPATSLDTNGLIPRSFCPQVYDGVRKTVGDMRDEAQYAAWYWVVESGPECTGYTESGGGCEERESIGWHPCFTLPANRRVVTRYVTHNTLNPPSTLTNTKTNTAPSPPQPRRRSISSSSYPSTNPDHHVRNLTGTHARRSSGDATRRMSLVREESKSEEGSVDAVGEKIRRSSSLHGRPAMVGK